MSTAADEITIHAGYVPGLLGAALQPTVQHTAPLAGFGAPFEAFVAADLATLLSRMQLPANPFRNQCWAALRGAQIVGAVFLETHDPASDVGHLRCFVVEDVVRGRGVGGRLLAALTEHADAIGLREVHLWTFSMLEGARRIYERAGFKLVEEREGNMWGASVNEQRFVRVRGGGT